MPQFSLSDYSARIKEVYIELKNYRFHHSPYSGELDDQRFIGRTSVKRRIRLILKNSRTKSGAYLVTGFRGMGKTSVVREAIREYNKNIKFPVRKNIPIWDYSCYNWYHFLFYALGIGIVFVLLKNEYSPYLSIGFALGIPILLAIFSCYKKNEKILDAVWNYYKNLTFILFLLGFLFYFINPIEFCIQFQCFPNKARWPSLFEPGQNFLFRSLLGLFVGYCIVSIIYFTKDLLVLFYKKESTKSLISAKSEFYKKFEINLSQDSLLEEEILKRITKEMLLFWVSKKKEFSLPVFDRKVYYPWQFLLSILKINKNEGASSYESVLHQLLSLSQRISGQVTSLKELNLNPGLSISVSSLLKSITIPFGKFTNKNQVAYPIASPKEIEDELIEIFKQIDLLRYKEHKGQTHHQKTPHNLPIPRFLFIIDELDKIEPHSSSNLEERESSNPSLDLGFNAPGNSKFRQRQEAVASLLGNLKGFLNVVRAKFFFIAGREMFDADLADIADRDSFYSSIFNDVIYVNSFFKDKVNIRAGISQMTEAYLCKIIMADLQLNGGLEDKSYSLKHLAERIAFSEQPFLTLQKDKVQVDGLNKIREFQRFKIIYLLQNYIIYLIYRSNGAPKKLASLTEKIILDLPLQTRTDLSDKQKREKKEAFCKENLVLLQHHYQDSKEELNREWGAFIRFRFDFQHEIGLTANLYRPYLIINSRHIKSLGDKLLFSSAFIIDHIMKFHSFGFSWRNLELIPEVILVNKEPNLRRFIEEIIRFLSSTYIRSTVSGIFQYRFYSRVSRELTYLSKTSAIASAAFNFTLDESLQIKRHYKKKLIELRNKHKDYQPIHGDNQFLHSLCFVQTILGDLYYYDKEYDEALLYYTESIQALRLPNAIKDQLLTRHQFLLWLRNKLKLGLTLEKMRAFDSAFSYYRTLMLDTSLYLKKLFPGLRKTDYQASDVMASDDHRTIQMVSMPFVAHLGIIEKARSDGITYFNLKQNAQELISIIFPEKQISHISPKIRGDEYRRHLLLADYYNNVGSLLFYKNCQFPKLYKEDEYKLGSLNEKIRTQVEAVQEVKRSIDYSEKYIYDFQPSLAAFNYYWEALHQLLVCHKERIIERLKPRLENTRQNKIPLTLQNEPLSYLALATAYLFPECSDLINTHRFHYIANVISKIGDTLLACLDEDNFVFPEWNINSIKITTHDKTRPELYENILDLMNLFHKMVKGQEKIFSVKSIILTYQLAGALYLRAGRNYSYAFQIKKTLYLIKDLLNASKNDKGSNVERIKKFLAPNSTTSSNIFITIEDMAVSIFHSSTWNYEVSNRPQILKYRKILNILDRDTHRDIIYNNINNGMDIREAIFIAESIKMKLSTIERLDVRANAFGKSYDFLLSPYNSISNRYSRILELKYRSEWCYYILTEILQGGWLLNHSFENDSFKIKKNSSLYYVFVEFIAMGEKKSFHISKKLISSRMKQHFPYLLESAEGEINCYQDILSFLIKEAIFCLRELIKMVRLFEPAYVIGFSYLAEGHRRMGAWSRAYNNHMYFLQSMEHEANYKGKDEIFDKELDTMIGQNALAYLEANNHYELAQQSYYQTIQMHTEGRAYKAHVLNLYCLEDDYNENLTHFNIAAERLRVNTGDIRRKITKLKKNTDHSRLYQYDSYFHQEIIKQDHQKTVENMEILKELMEWKFD